MKDLNDKLYPLEERLVQYRARAGEDLINYPTGIDSKLARLIDFASMADAPPTDGEQDLLKRMTAGIAERRRRSTRSRARSTRRSSSWRRRRSRDNRPAGGGAYS